MQRNSNEEYKGKNYFNKHFVEQNKDLKKEFDILNQYLDEAKNPDT